MIEKVITIVIVSVLTLMTMKMGISILHTTAKVHETVNEIYEIVDNIQMGDYNG